MPHSRPRLTVDLDALAENYRHVRERLAGVPAGAAVKADAYGLGIEPVARRLWSEGCGEFFVANVDEGIELRGILPQANINVFDGAAPGTEDALVVHGLVPVVITLDQLSGWQATASRRGVRLPVGVHFDTGINRTGLGRRDTATLMEEPDRLDGLDLRHVVSHLASADEPTDQSERQLERFRAIRAAFPGGLASLANSAGIFRGTEFHFDLGRPGIALYGGAPSDALDRPLSTVVTLEAPILQVREVETGDEIGYGATHVVDGPRVHAVVGLGYADGYHRAGSNRAEAVIEGQVVPVVGRVSMDLTILDVTDVPPAARAPGSMVELLGPVASVERLGAAAGTISYEVFTSLGSRYERVYLG
ncbi:MAG: alanine racemase [Acidimicrobiales bacterium]